MEEEMLSSFFFICCFLGLEAQLVIDVTFDESNNCVTANLDECQPFIAGSVSASQDCECLKNIKNSECYDECLQYYCGYDLEAECEQCKFNCKLDECGITRFVPRCKPCAIVYRLIADFAPIPNDPRGHPGNRFTSQIFRSGGIDGEGTCNTDLTCEDPCRIECHDNHSISFECFELPPDWQELSSGNNVCYGIQILSISYVHNCEGTCPTQIGRGFWNCIIICFSPLNNHT